MTPEIERFISLLESQLGYREKSDDYTKFGGWYGENVEFDADYSSAPWCDMFLAWAANKLGYEAWMGEFAWTVAHAKWFRQNDAWGTKPEPGAFVFFDWSGTNDINRIDHVGVVTRVEGGRIHTIEGNIDGGVAKRKVRDTDKVVGYGYPAQIKERLEEQKVLREARQSADQQRSGDTSSGEVLQDGPLGSLIPYSEVYIEEVQPPSAARSEWKAPKPANQSQQAGAPTPAPARAGAGAGATAEPKAAAGTAAPQAGATGQSERKGKHAKPSTADTKAVTSEPLPPLVEAARPVTSPALDSPSLVGSALVAALALLAIAKTRQLRARPALAASAPAGVSTAASASAGVSTAASASASPSRRKSRTSDAPVRVEADTRARHRADSARRRHAVSGSRHAASGARHAPSGARHAASAARHSASETHAASGGRHSASQPRHAAEIPAPPDLTTPAPPEPETPVWRRSEAPRGRRRRTLEPIVIPHRPESAPLSPSRLRPFEPPQHHEPVQPTIAGRGRHADPLEAALGGAGGAGLEPPFATFAIPEATSRFDAFAPASRPSAEGQGDPAAGSWDAFAVPTGPGRSRGSRHADQARTGRPEASGGGYRGRRRRSGHPVEEPSFVADAPPRGRRHRVPAPYCPDQQRTDQHRDRHHGSDQHGLASHRIAPHWLDPDWADPDWADPDRADPDRADRRWTDPGWTDPDVAGVSAGGRHRA
jgi:hypothetical protein